MEKENDKNADERAQAAAQNAQGSAAQSSGARQSLPPQAAFVTLVESLAAQALAQMAEPAAGKKEKDLQSARFVIDILEVLEEKTRGNLTENERAFLQAVLYDLRIRFVKASG